MKKLGFTMLRALSKFTNSAGGGLRLEWKKRPGSSRMLDGFTLIELLVVIAIVGILIATGSVSYLTASKQSRDTRRKADIEQIRQALETFRSQYGYYPDLTSDLVADFITVLPKDPKEATDYEYVPTGVPPRDYTLCASLESLATYPECNYPVKSP